MTYVRVPVKSVKSLALLRGIAESTYGFDNTYVADKSGNVYRVKTRHNGYYIASIMKPVKDKDGYLDYVLRVPIDIDEPENGYKQIHVHGQRIIAGLFCKRRPGCNYVNHKDKVRDNNEAGNLEWTTHKENIRHRDGNR